MNALEFIQINMLKKNPREKTGAHQSSPKAGELLTVDSFWKEG